MSGRPAVTLIRDRGNQSASFNHSVYNHVRRAQSDTMTDTSSNFSASFRAVKWSRVALWSAFVVLGALGAWFIPQALIPLETGYTYDPVTHVEFGPWVPWAYLICGVALLAIAVVTSCNRYWPTVLLLAPALIWAWSFTASREDMTGLWRVGLIFITFYTVVGTLTVLGATRCARSLSDQRKSAAARRKRLPPLPE